LIKRGFRQLASTQEGANVVAATFLEAEAAEILSAGESTDETVKLARTEGYLASLGVYHEVHCLVSDELLIAAYPILANSQY
jgi:hypothetical protein